MVNLGHIILYVACTKKILKNFLFVILSNFSFDIFHPTAQSSDTIKINERFCVSNLNARNSYLIKWVMFEPLGLKEACFIKLEFLRKAWLIQNL